MNFEEFKLRVKGVLDNESKVRPLRLHDLRSASERVGRLPIPNITYGRSAVSWPHEEVDDLDNINPDSIRLMLEKVIDLDQDGEVKTYELKELKDLIDNRDLQDDYPTIVEDPQEQDFRDALMLLDEVWSLGQRFRKNGNKVNKKLTRDFNGYLDAVELFLDNYTMDASEIKEVRDGREAIDIG